MPVIAHCQCGPVAEVEVVTLWKWLPMWASVTGLAPHLRCASCDEMGRAEVDARRALGYDRLGLRALSVHRAPVGRTE